MDFTKYVFYMDRVSGHSMTRDPFVAKRSSDTSKPYTLRAVGMLLGGPSAETRAEFRTECNDAITMCEAAFWDEEVNRCEFLHLDY